MCAFTDGIGCFNPIAVNRRNSHRSQRKSSSSASSIASVLSQLQSTPPVQINDNFDLNAKTPENYLPASPKNYLPPSPKNYPPPSPGFNPISISRRPPPPTSALQRRIDAYCAAANLNSKEQNLIQKRKS